MWSSIHHPAQSRAYDVSVVKEHDSEQIQNPALHGEWKIPLKCTIFVQYTVHKDLF